MRCLIRVAATGCQGRMADFASAFVARDEMTATHFELRIGKARQSVRAGLSDCTLYECDRYAVKADPRSETSAKLDRAGSARDI
jgi:hypothetical protein